MPLGDPTQLGYQAGRAGPAAIGAGIKQLTGTIGKIQESQRTQQIDLINSLVKGGLAEPILDGEQADFTISGVSLKLKKPGLTLVDQIKQTREQAEFEEELELKKQKETRQTEQADIMGTYREAVTRYYEEKTKHPEKFRGGFDIYNIPGMRPQQQGGGGGQVGSDGLQVFNSEADALAANLPPGRKFKILGESFTYEAYEEE